jgi:RHS repeat-associated protein
LDLQQRNSRYESRHISEIVPNSHPGQNNKPGSGVFVQSSLSHELLSGSTISNTALASARPLYNWNRYYDPKIGRYITSDPIGLKGGLNSYAYVRNNPQKFIDPLGLYGTTSCAYYSEACAATLDPYACSAQYICPIFPKGEENGGLQCVRQCLQEEHRRRNKENNHRSCLGDNPLFDHSTCFTACFMNSSNPGGSTDYTRPSEDVHW